MTALKPAAIPPPPDQAMWQGKMAKLMTNVTLSLPGASINIISIITNKPTGDLLPCEWRAARARGHVAHSRTYGPT